MLDVTRLIIGFFFNLEIWIVLALNVFVFICMIKGGTKIMRRSVLCFRLLKEGDNSELDAFYKKWGQLFWGKDHAVYVLTGFSILCETCQILLHMIYIGPSFLRGSYFFKGQDSIGVMVVGALFFSMCYLGSFIQILLATNRLAVVYFPSRTFLSHKRVLIMIALCCIGSVAMIIYSQFILPCCRIVPNPKIYSYSYLTVSGQPDNIAMRRIDLPFFFMTSIYSGVSYIAFFKHILATGTRAGVRELRYFIQFMLMFLTYTIVWLTFFLYPVIGITIPGLYAVTAIVLIMNCGTNSVVYLVMCKEVRYAANQIFGRALFNDTQYLPKRPISHLNQIRPLPPIKAKRPIF